MAIVSPVLILILMGIIEFGWLFYFKQAMVTASRVGARRGTLPAATTSQITTAVDQVMTNIGLTKATYSYTTAVTRATDAEPYEKVLMSVPYNKVTVLGSFFNWLNITSIDVSSSFRREMETPP